MRVSWIYQLCREELINELEKYKLITPETIREPVKYLSQLLIKYVRENEEKFSDKPIDDEDYNELADMTQDEVNHQLERLQKTSSPNLHENQPVFSFSPENFQINSAGRKMHETIKWRGRKR